MKVIRPFLLCKTAYFAELAMLQIAGDDKCNGEELLISLVFAGMAIALITRALRKG